MNFKPAVHIPLTPALSLVRVYRPKQDRGRSAAFRPLHRPHFPGARGIPKHHTYCSTRKRRKRRAPYARAATTLDTNPMEDVLSGVRLSSGAETQGEPVAFGQSDPLERADVAAAEDGRTPLNTYVDVEFVVSEHCSFLFIRLHLDGDRR